MAYQLEKKALNKVKTLSATDYIALINNVERQKNAGNVLITWRDFLAEVGMDLSYIQNLTTDNLLASNLFASSLQVTGPFVVSDSPENIGGGGIVPLTNMFVFVNTVVPEAYTLPAGNFGQYITIIMRTDGGDATITPSMLRGYTSFKLTAVGASITLWYDGAMWNLISVAGGITLV